MVKRTRSIPTPSIIDRRWPHQVALPDDICTERNFTRIARFCDKMSAAPQIRRVQAIWPDGKYEEWRLHCFANQADAKAFLDHFGGIIFDPAKDRENGRAMGVWRRTGEYERILELGPLSVPESLRY